MLLLSIFVTHILLAVPFFVDAFPQAQVLPPLDPGMSRIAGKFVIDCRSPIAAYFPDPEDCRTFYHCSDWTGLQKKTCGNELYFNPQTEVCDWPYNVARFRPECPDIKDLDPIDKHPRAFQSIGTVNEAAQLRFVPLSTNPVRFPDPTPSEPLSKFTAEHGIPGLGFTSLREEPRNINPPGNRGRVVNQLPNLIIQATPLPPLNEIDELQAPKGFRSSKPGRQPLPSQVTINTVESDLVITTPFPPVRHVRPQATRQDRPFNIHPFQTSFDQIQVPAAVLQEFIRNESQRPKQIITTSSPPPPSPVTTTTTTTTTRTPDVTTSQAQIQTTSSGEEQRRQRIKNHNRTRKTTTPKPQKAPLTTKTTIAEPEIPRSASPLIRNQNRGRLVANRVRRPINGNRSRRPQKNSNAPVDQGIIQQEVVNRPRDQDAAKPVIDRRPVPLANGRIAPKPTQRAVVNNAKKPNSEGVSNIRLKQRQRVRGDTAFLVCSEGKCTRPKAGDTRFAVNDLKTSASARLPDNTFNRLFEQMLVNSGIDSTDDEEQGKVLSLLEAAKVKFEEDPETDQFVLEQLLETTAQPVEQTTSTFEEEQTTSTFEEETTTNRFQNARRRPFRPFVKPKPISQILNQQELEKELQIEEQLEQAAEEIIEESESVDEGMLLEMAQIKENIKRIKEQIEALKQSQKPVKTVIIDDATEVSVQTATSVSIVGEDNQTTTARAEIPTITEQTITTQKVVDGTTIVPKEEIEDETTTLQNQEEISTQINVVSETTQQPLIGENEVGSTSVPGLKVFNAVPVTTLLPNTDDKSTGEKVFTVESFLHDFEPLFDDESFEGSGEQTVFVVNPVQINTNEEEVPVEVTTVSQEKTSQVPSAFTEPSKEATTLAVEDDIISTTVFSTVGPETTSIHNGKNTSPSSFDLLVNLMDHFNLNAIINSLSEDTLDQQIKVKLPEDNSEEELQESVIIPSKPKFDNFPTIQTTTEVAQQATEKLKITTGRATAEPEVSAQPTAANIIVPSLVETSLNDKTNNSEEMVHIVMPAGWSTTLINDVPSTSEVEPQSTSAIPATQQVNKNEQTPETTDNPTFEDDANQSQEVTLKDGFVIATNKPLIRFPTRKVTVVEKKVRFQNSFATTRASSLEITTSALAAEQTEEENKVTTRIPNLDLVEITTDPSTTVSLTTTTTTPEPTTIKTKVTTLKNEEATTKRAIVEITSQPVFSESEDEQETIISTTIKQLETENPTTIPEIEVPRSSSGRIVNPGFVENINDEEEPEATPVVIVVPSGSEINVETTTKLTESDGLVKDDVSDEEIKEESATKSPVKEVKIKTFRKKGRFSSNRDKIRKRLRLKIGGKGSLDALSFIRSRQEEEKKKNTKNSFFNKGNSSSDKKEEKKIDVKKLQSRRKELFRKRVRVTRPAKVFAATRSPPIATTTRSDNLRTTSRFIPPASGESDNIVRLPSTGSRSRGILVRGKPQTARGLFSNRRPTAPLPKKLEGTNPTVSISSSTTSIKQLQKQLQQQQEQLQRLQENPSQNDEGGGKNILLKRKELPKDNKSDSRRKEQQNNNSNIRCRFFKNSC